MSRPSWNTIFLYPSTVQPHPLLTYDKYLGQKKGEDLAFQPGYVIKDLSINKEAERILFGACNEQGPPFLHVKGHFGKEKVVEVMK